MKKMILASSITILLAATILSCKKEEDININTNLGGDSTNVTPAANASTWTFRNNNYISNSDSYKANFLTASSGYDGNTIAVKFGSTPVNGKKYGVGVQTGGTIGTNNCLVYVQVNNSTYYSTGASGDSVTVSISGGYTIADLSNISVASTPGISTITYFLSGHVAGN